MTHPPFDPLRALRILHAHRVQFVVIGGFAGTLLGAPLVTNDLDVCYERSRANLERLVAALRAMSARLRVAKVEEDLPFQLDAETIAAGDSFTFVTDAGALDILATPSGTSGFRDLAAKARPIAVADELDVLVVDLADLMRMKKHSARPRDRIHLEVLEVLKEALEEQGG